MTLFDEEILNHNVDCSVKIFVFFHLSSDTNSAISDQYKKKLKSVKSD